MKKFKLPKIEFYITNVCNLTCQGCNRFNNYKFTGFQRWTDYESVYEEWAKELNVGHISLMGGEPMLNPEFMLWIRGLRRLWPDNFLRIVTNGYRLNKVPGLYDFLLEHRDQTLLDIGLHNKMSKQMIMDNVHQLLKGPIKSEFDNSNPYQQKLYLTDCNNVKIRVEYNWWFHQGSLINVPDSNKFTLHTSDPIKAHDLCSMKDCYHFVHGKIYKCGVVALLPEFAEQHELVLSPEDKDLMLNYRPLMISDSDEIKQHFLDHIVDPIDQCRFCPEEYHGEQIFSEEKKVVFYKR